MRIISLPLIILCLLLTSVSLFPLHLRADAPPTLAKDLRDQIDKVITENIKSSDSPSMSVAIIQDGQIVYTQAFGNAQLAPAKPATPAMRYEIGSISKQFTATALLMLQEAGKLKLDDHVSKFLPKIAHAHDVTIRELLTQTSGYQDYWPQDYLAQPMLKPIAPADIIANWGAKPLDFEPRTQWQYSNTNYVIAGLIVEKVSRRPIFEFLKERIFKPLDMKSVVNVDDGPLGPEDPAGYMRIGHGPIRRAMKEAKGWLFAMGELAMTAEDLAKWDIALMQKKFMKPASIDELERGTLLKNGVALRYGLGVGVRLDAGLRMILHDGRISGFAAQNTIYPDKKIGVVVLLNQDWSDTPWDVASAISKIMNSPQADPEHMKQVQDLFALLASGKINRDVFSENGNSYYSPAAIKDFAEGMRGYGAPTKFEETDRELRGGMELRVYRVKFKEKEGQLTVRWQLPEWKIEQFQFF